MSLNSIVFKPTESNSERERETFRGGEIARQALWKPQADWAGNQPTIQVQTTALKQDLSPLSL